MPQPIFPLDSSAQTIYGHHQAQQNSTLHRGISNGPITHCPLNPLDASLCQNIGMQLPQLNGFSEVVSQVIIQNIYVYIIIAKRFSLCLIIH